MRPQTIGRRLGIGLRVAGRIASQRLAAGSQSSASQVVSESRAAEAAGRRQSSGLGAKASFGSSRSLAAGLRGFLSPFRRVGGILWLEVMGVFFLFPALVFLPTLWRTRMSWEQGPYHRTFWASLTVVVVFFYLGISSFWRARRRQNTPAPNSSR
jgi:hypothetical protein